MFFRIKKSGPREYLQIVENRWEDGKSRQHVITTLGRLDHLRQQGRLDSLLASGARFTETVMLLSEHKKCGLDSSNALKIGPALVFERLWKETGCSEVVKDLLADRKFQFDVERAIFLTVLHRLFAPGSDRSADEWRLDYKIKGVEDLKLHHLYRAMEWLGEELPGREQFASTLSPRCTKDKIEEALFECRRDLFTGLDLVFFDTTSIYFEGSGGEDLGRYGHSKDHRPDRKQMVVGAVLDNDGKPICCEMWPGNTTDVKTLIPLVDRFRHRFGIEKVCVVADAGMISSEVMEELEKRNIGFILGTRKRSVKEIRDEVLADKSPFLEVRSSRMNSKDPAPLKVKDVVIEGRRYVVCFNEEQAQTDAYRRGKLLEKLHEKLGEGAKTLISNKGFSKFLTAKDKPFEIDEEKIAKEADFDGIWVLRTNMKLSAAETALKYKQLIMVEGMFRSMKSVLNTRPIYHRTDSNIMGHVFCSFLALVLRKELEDRLAAKGEHLEWASIVRDLNEFQEIVVEKDGKKFALRTDLKGIASKVIRAAGVAIPKTVRQL